MKSPICDLLDIEFPLVAFTHCRDVVVEVSKAGGMGVLGAAGYSPEQLEIELNWIDERIEGKPYGVDLIAPTSMVDKDETRSVDELAEMVPDHMKQFASGILARHNIDTSDIYEEKPRGRGGMLGEKRAANIIDVAFDHPIKLIVNALGVPPAYMLEMAKQRGVPTGALVGAKHHALKQAEAGVDILIVAGGEAGMKHFIGQFGPCLSLPWTKLMEVPELTEELVTRIADQSDAQSGQYSIRELERIRDDNLVSMMRALKARDWGAGAVMNAHDARLAEIQHALPAWY